MAVRRWRFYTTVSGACPVRSFLNDLTYEDRTQVLLSMRTVTEEGLAAAKHLQGDMYEVRASGATQTFRVLFATEGARSQILLGVEAFSKKTQKTPPQMIRNAQRRLFDWRERGRS